MVRIVGARNMCCCCCCCNCFDSVLATVGVRLPPVVLFLGPRFRPGVDFALAAAVAAAAATAAAAAAAADPADVTFVTLVASVMLFDPCGMTTFVALLTELPKLSRLSMRPLLDDDCALG